MNKLLAALLASLPVVSAAGGPPQAFADVKIDAPPFSLVANSLLGAPGFISDFGRQSKATRQRVEVVSRMPIVPPKSELDLGMVRTPDPSTDYKLLVKSPDMEPAK
jgi:hypothetical protein